MTFRTTRTLAAVLLAGWLLAAPHRSTAATETPLNLNTASASELATLKGIGDVKARAIVDYREKNGPFKSVDALKDVPGIGDKMLEALRPQVTIGAAGPAAPAAASAKH
jgi:competence protein ComEA